MRSARLETVPASVSVATTRCHCQEGCPKMNKFEQLSSDHHQMWTDRHTPVKPFHNFVGGR